MFTICLQQTLLDDAISGSSRTIIFFPRPKRTAIYEVGLEEDASEAIAASRRVTKSDGFLYRSKNSSFDMEVPHDSKNLSILAFNSNTVRIIHSSEHPVYIPATVISSAGCKEKWSLSSWARRRQPGNNVPISFSFWLKLYTEMRTLLNLRDPHLAATKILN
jgi:hypothetical protein